MNVKNLSYRKSVMMGEFVGVKNKGMPNYGFVGMVVPRSGKSQEPKNAKVIVQFKQADHVWSCAYDHDDLIPIFSLGVSAFTALIESR